MTATSLDTLRTEIILTAPAYAQVLRKTAEYGRQRPIADSHVKRLSAEMTAGRFIKGTQVHICVLGDTLAIVNGNHTLEAVIDSGVEIPLSYLYTQVKSEAEIAKIYANHDIGRARVWADAIRAAGLFTDMDASHQYITCFGSAMLPIMLEFKDVRARTTAVRGPTRVDIEAASRERRIAMMRRYRGQAEFYYLCVKLARPRIQLWMRRSAVMAIALETFKRQPSLATEFWEGFARDDGLKNNDPRKLLLLWLQENTGQNRKISQLRVVASAWNAFFDRKPITFLRSGTEGPFVLRGTPWGSGAQGEPVTRKPAEPTLAIGSVTDRSGHSRHVATLLGKNGA